MKKCILCGIVCAALAAGCGGENGTAGGAPDSGSPQGGAPDSGASDADPPDASTEIGTIALLSATETNGTAIRNNNEEADGVTVAVSVTNIELVDPADHTTHVSGEGHYHVYLDSDTGDNYIACGYETEMQVAIPADTTTGPHRIHVELQDNIHHRINPSGGGVSGEDYISVYK